MVKLRLRRMGRKKRPVYDIVASDSRTPRDGRFLEKVGQYNPLMENTPVTILKRDRVLYWLGTGAQPTDTVRSLLSKEGVLLEVHMKRKGRDQQEIDAALEQHTATRQSKMKTVPAKKAAAAPAAAAPAAAAPAAEHATPVVEAGFSATEEAEARGINEPPISIQETPPLEADAAAANEAPAADAPAAEAPAADAPAAEAPAADAPAAEAPAADAPTEG